MHTGLWVVAFGLTEQGTIAFQGPPPGLSPAYDPSSAGVVAWAALERLWSSAAACEMDFVHDGAVWFDRPITAEVLTLWCVKHDALPSMHPAASGMLTLLVGQPAVA